MKEQKSTWTKIRENAGLTKTEFAKKIGSSVQAIWNFENGVRPMPPRFQIEYLKLRNTDKDKVIIEYLESL